MKKSISPMPQHLSKTPFEPLANIQNLLF